MSKQFEQSIIANTQTPPATYDASLNPLTEYNGGIQTDDYPMREPAPSRYPSPDLQQQYQAPTSSAVYTPTQWCEQAPTGPPHYYQQQAVFEPQHHHTAQSVQYAPPGYHSEYDIQQLRSWYPMPTQEPVPYPPSMAGVYNAWLPNPSTQNFGPQSGGEGPVGSPMLFNTWDVAMPNTSPMVSNPETINNPPNLYAPVQQPSQRFFDFPNVLDDSDVVLASAGGHVGSVFDGTQAWEGDGGQGFEDVMQMMPMMPVVEEQSFVGGQSSNTVPQEYVRGIAAGIIPDLQTTLFKPP